MTTVDATIPLVQEIAVMIVTAACMNTARKMRLQLAEFVSHSANGMLGIHCAVATETVNEPNIVLKLMVRETTTALQNRVQIVDKAVDAIEIAPKLRDVFNFQAATTTIAENVNCQGACLTVLSLHPASHSRRKNH